jgi:hypothetical protein
MAVTYKISIFDPKEWDYGFGGQAPNTNTRRTVEAWGEYYKNCLIYNLGVFNTSTGASYTFVAGENVLCDASGETDPKIGGKSKVLILNAKNRCKGYSDGIINGVISINAPMGGTAVRNGIGITASGKAIQAQSMAKSTEYAFCAAVNAYAKLHSETVKLFILEDGGGSTSDYSPYSKLGWHATGERREVATIFWARRKTPAVFHHDLYKNCPYKSDIMLWQTLTGGLEVDGSFGSLSVKRLAKMHVALNLPKALRIGVAGIDTFKAMGCSVG